MIRSGNAVRLTKKDVSDLEAVTGLKPAGINTVFQLMKYFEDSKARYPGNDEDSRICRGVIDRVGVRMLQENAATPMHHRRNMKARIYLAILNRVEAAVRRVLAA